MVIMIIEIQNLRDRITCQVHKFNNGQCFLQWQNEGKRNEKRKIRCVSQKGNSFSFFYEQNIFLWYTRVFPSK